MKIICPNNKVINLDHFDIVRYRKSFPPNQNIYLVEAVKREASRYSDRTIDIPEEIARFTKKADAQALSAVIGAYWLHGYKGLDITKYVSKQPLPVAKGNTKKKRGVSK